MKAKILAFVASLLFPAALAWDRTATQNDYNANKAKWDSQGIVNYQYSNTASPTDGNAYPFTTWVWGGNAIAMNDATGKPITWTSKSVSSSSVAGHLQENTFLLTSFCLSFSLLRPWEIGLE